MADRPDLVVGVGLEIDSSQSIKKIIDQLDTISKQVKLRPEIDTEYIQKQAQKLTFEQKKMNVKLEVENLGNILKGDNKGLSNSAKSYISNLNKELNNAAKSIDLTPVTQEINKTLSNVDIQKNLFAGFEKLKSGEAYGTLTPINNIVNELKKIPPEAKNATEAYAKFNEELKKGQDLQKQKGTLTDKLSIGQQGATNQNVIKFYDDLIKKVQQLSSLTGKGTTVDGAVFNIGTLQKEANELNKINKLSNEVAINLKYLKDTAKSESQVTFISNLQAQFNKLPTDLATTNIELKRIKSETNNLLKIDAGAFEQQKGKIVTSANEIAEALKKVGQIELANKLTEGVSSIGAYTTKAGSSLAKLSGDVDEASKRLAAFNQLKEKLSKEQSQFAKGSVDYQYFENLKVALEGVNLAIPGYYNNIQKIQGQANLAPKLQEQTDKLSGLKSKYDELLTSLKSGIDLNVGGSQDDITRIAELQNKLRSLNVSPDIKKNADAIKEITNEIKKLESDLGKGQLLGTAKSQFNSLNLTVKSATEIVKQFNTEAKSIKVSNISQTGDWKTFNAQIQQADGSLKSVKMSVNSMTNEVRQLDRGLATTNNSLLQAIKNMLGIGSATMIAYKAFGMLRNAVGVVIELSDAMIELQMITQQSAESVEESVKQYQQLASELSSTTSAVTKAAIEFARQGRSATDTTNLLKTSQVFSKVGFLESTEAAELLTSAINGYKIEAQDAMSIVDKMSAIDVNAATSTKELATALQYTAASADLAGVSLDETLAYIATISSVTRRSAESIKLTVA